jgi:hypothetical protein
MADPESKERATVLAEQRKVELVEGDGVHPRNSWIAPRRWVCGDGLDEEVMRPPISAELPDVDNNPRSGDGTRARGSSEPSWVHLASLDPAISRCLRFGKGFGQDDLRQRMP